MKRFFRKEIISGEVWKGVNPAYTLYWSRTRYTVFGFEFYGNVVWG